MLVKGMQYLFSLNGFWANSYPETGPKIWKRILKVNQKWGQSLVAKLTTREGDGSHRANCLVLRDESHWKLKCMIIVSWHQLELAELVDTALSEAHPCSSSLPTETIRAR